MSNKPYLYVIRKKHDVDDLDKYLEAIRGVGEFNYFCKPEKCYNVRWAYGFFRYLKTDLVAAITVDRSDIWESFRIEAGIDRTPRIEQRAIGDLSYRKWRRHDYNWTLQSWQDYAYQYVDSDISVDFLEKLQNQELP